MVGVDGSVGSDTAVVLGGDLRRCPPQTPDDRARGGRPGGDGLRHRPRRTREELRTAGRRVTDHALGLAQEAGPGVAVDVRVELCEPRSLLAEAATGAHLLVLGSRGHGAALSLLLGSVSVALAAHAPCPVAVVRPTADDEQRPVVVGIDGTADSPAP